MMPTVLCTSLVDSGHGKFKDRGWMYRVECVSLHLLNLALKPNQAHQTLFLVLVNGTRHLV